MMKCMFVSLLLLVLPLVHAHRLLGYWDLETTDHVPIENHLSDGALQVLKTVFDDTGSEKKGMLGYFRHLFSVLVDKLD